MNCIKLQEKIKTTILVSRFKKYFLSFGSAKKDFSSAISKTKS